MPSHLIDYSLFGNQFSTPEMRAIFDERAMIQRWLDVEAALALAQAELGLIPAEAGPAIAAAAQVERLDLEAVKRDLEVMAHPILPIVRGLERAVVPHGRWVHWGTTTQDIMDTGMVLQLKDAHVIFRRDLVALIRGIHHYPFGFGNSPVSDLVNVLVAAFRDPALIQKLAGNAVDAREKAFLFKQVDTIHLDGIPTASELKDLHQDLVEYVHILLSNQDFIF